MTAERIDAPLPAAVEAAAGSVRPVGGWPALGAFGLLAASMIFFCIALNEPITLKAILWDGLSLAAYIYGLLLIVRVVKGAGFGLGRWRIGPWMLLWAGTMYGLASMTLDQVQSTVAAQIIPENVLRALWLVAVGMTFWFAGYLLGPGKLVRRAAARGIERLRFRYADEPRGVLTPWLLYAIGTIARFAGALVSGRFGYVGNAASAVSTASWYSQILILLSMCSIAGIVVAALQVFRERAGSARIALLILFLAEIAYSITSGQKENYANAILAVAIPYTAVKSRWPVAMLLTVGAIFLAIVIPFTAAYRSAARDTVGGTVSAGETIGAAPEILRNTLTSGDSLLVTVPASVGYLLARGQDIDAPAIILQRTPSQIPYSSPAQLIIGPLTALIPRALWPGKPIFATGYQFGQEYYEIPSGIYSSTTITPIGDLYRHGGRLPVLTGMFFFGCLIRLFDDFLDVRENPHTILLVIMLFPSLVMSEQGWITLLAAIPMFVLLWWFIVAIAFRGQRRAAT